jgi:hypothetical protein
LRKTASVTVNRIPITKARINLGQLAKRAHLNNEYFILEKDGIPIIGIMDADEMEDYLEVRDPPFRSSSRRAMLNTLRVTAGQPETCSQSSSSKRLVRRGAANA